MVFDQNEVVGSLALEDVLNVYSDDDPGEEDCFNAVATNYQAAADQAASDGGNVVGSSVSGGATTSQFDSWTLASANSW